MRNFEATRCRSGSRKTSGASQNPRHGGGREEILRGSVGDVIRAPLVAVLAVAEDGLHVERVIKRVDVDEIELAVALLLAHEVVLDKVEYDFANVTRTLDSPVLEHHFRKTSELLDGELTNALEKLRARDVLAGWALQRNNVLERVIQGFVDEIVGFRVVASILANQELEPLSGVHLGCCQFLAQFLSCLPDAFNYR